MADDLFQIPATRRTDPATSHQAAETVARGLATIRARVLEYGARCPQGFIDEELAQLDPSSPYSSYTKRRTELMQEGWFVDSGRQKLNSHGNAQIVWLHRDFAANPPPLQERQPSKPVDTAKAEARAMSLKMGEMAETFRKMGFVHAAPIMLEASQLLARLSR